MAAQRLRDLLDFLAVVNAQAEHSKENQKRLLDGCLRDFVGGPAIPMAEGTMMIKDVQEASIPEWMKAAVVQTVQEKMLCASGDQKKGARGVLQRHNYVYNYFTQEDWDDLRSDAKSISTKIQIFKRLFQAIGLAHPTEPTFVLTNSILHLSCYNGAIEDFQCDLDKAFRVLQDIKAVVRGSVKKTAHSGIEVYPSDPMELSKDLLHKAYKDETPVKCPLDISSILDLAAILPARATHTEVKHTRSRNHPFKESNGMNGMMKDANVQNFLASALMEKLFNQKNGEAALTFFGAGHGQNLKRKKSQLAIEDAQDAEEMQLEDRKPEAKGDDEKTTEKQGDVKTTSTKPPASVDAMAAAIYEQLDSNKESNKEGKPKATKKTPEPKKQNKAKAKAKAKAKSETMKGAKGINTKKKFPFSGTHAQGPMHLENCTVYTCPKSFNWRVKKTGEKVDKAFSWRKDDPEEVWARLVEYVQTL